jgi:hypothetical protein
LPPKGDVSDWIAAGGTAADLDRLAADAPPAAIEEPSGPIDAGKPQVRPEITVRAGERHKAADQGIAALQAAGVAFYQRGSALVRVCDVRARSMTGEVIMVPGIAAVTPAILERALGQTATWQRFDEKRPRQCGSTRRDPWSCRSWIWSASGRLRHWPASSAVRPCATMAAY